MIHKVYASLIILSVLTAAFYGCGGNGERTESNLSQAASGSASETDSAENSYADISDPEEKPATNAETFDYLMKLWRAGDTAPIYEYAGDEIKFIISETDFIRIFGYLSHIGGKFLSYKIAEKSVNNGADIFQSSVDFENITVDMTVTIHKLKITGLVRNVFFKNEFIINKENNLIGEKYFIFENEGYKLNAVYTYVADGAEHPTVLFINGSGPCDYNETVGLLTSFDDMATKLAEKGINSLRMDKRTLNYGGDFEITDGIEEEYLSDFRAALGYISSQNAGGGIYLLGHSLGGQIASVLASEENNFGGIIFFNSSARNLADIAYDQYSHIDPENVASYAANTEAAKTADGDTAKGLYYYGVSDYYWASLNKIDVVGNIKKSNLPVLIINSTYDKHSFDSDINLWNDAFAGDKNAVIYVDDKISHFGYEIDTENQNSFFKVVPFPERIIDKITDFILELT